jgi:hypothetical protein
MVAMRKLFSSLVIGAACAAIGACSSGSSPNFGFGDDGGAEGGSGGSSGGGSGGSSGSASGSGSGSGGSGSSSGGHSSSSSGGSGSSSGGGNCTTPTGPVTGTVGANGGSISRLVFGVVGDTRPPNEDDVGGYPTPIITKIYQDIEGLAVKPPLVLGTGDYQFSSTSDNSDATQQIGVYMQARSAYSGAFFPAMGNHECGVGSGCSTSDDCNCVAGQGGNNTANLQAFMSGMMAPISQNNPYYSINVNATDNSWTAKFVITAANAWDSNQQTWLQNTMAQKTTYTFVVRHEPSDSTPVPPGVAGVDAVLTQYPYTMLFVGHTHDYGHWTSYEGTPACGSNCPPASRAVVVGNGGAPISSSKYDYGYVIASQRCDGAMVVDEYDYMTGASDSYFHFVITPGGTITQ